ncbi:hypothetical protein L596_009631 [Steinernema carpocapsae]|uniref:3-hydroxyanthranilate 3,4-dioxygenase n=1 Tax=Steinernema carpocapsae TaxID=34508 RepID=A0A4V6XWM5_STECR|nr:hypothetical protein L596_009631 [Steinernema carpocapsae]
MVLKVVENGEFKNVEIKQGEIFLLPGRIEHSPQRYANTLGCVVERTRAETEFDCLRYFYGSPKERLWERWIHLTDVVQDLPPLIKEFFAGETSKTGKPDETSFVRAPNYEPINQKLDKPINLENFIDEHLKQLEKGPVDIYDPNKYKTQVMLYGQGKHEVKASKGETLVFQQRGSSKITVDGKTAEVETFHLARVDDGKGFELEMAKDVVAVVVKMV